MKDDMRYKLFYLILILLFLEGCASSAGFKLKKENHQTATITYITGPFTENIDGDYEMNKFCSPKNYKTISRKRWQAPGHYRMYHQIKFQCVD